MCACHTKHSSQYCRGQLVVTENLALMKPNIYFDGLSLVRPLCYLFTDCSLIGVKERIVALLSNEELNVDSEEQVFDWAILWIQGDVTARNGLILEVLPLPRNGNLTVSQVASLLPASLSFGRCP